MRMQYFISIFLFWFTINVCTSQTAEFKKVSKNDLLKSKSLIEPDALAEYLHRSCTLEYEYVQSNNRFELKYTYFYRIKIYTDQELDIGDRVIKYYIGSKSYGNESVEKIEAYTFNLVDGKVKRHKLSKDNIYDSQINQRWATKKFAMPAVQVGSVLDIKFTVRSSNISSIKKFYLQQKYPVVFSKYELEIPEYYKYSISTSGYYPVEKSIETREENIKVLRRDAKRRQGLETLSAENSRYESKQYTVNIEKFISINIPTLKVEPYVNNMDNYRLGIGFGLYSSQLPDSKINYFSNTWENIGNVYLGLDNFGRQLDDNYGFEEFIDSISVFIQSERMESIFSEVCEQYIWNGFYSVVTYDGIRNLLETKKGNTAEINLLLTNLLRKSGISANPVVMRNRYSGNLNINYPRESELNYVIVQVEIDGRTIFLDATDSNIAAGQLPSRAINKYGIVVSDLGSRAIEITNSNIGLSSTMVEMEVLNNALKGKFISKNEGYFSYLLRSNFSSKEDYFSYLDLLIGAKVTEATITGLENRVGEVSYSCKATLNNHILKIEDKIIIDCALYFLPKTTPFTSKERQFAIFHNCRVSNSSVFKFKVPKGYKVESLPNNLNIVTPDNSLKCIVDFLVVGSEVVVTIRRYVRSDIISPEHYSAVIEYYDLLVAKGNEKIVLSKM